MKEYIVQAIAQETIDSFDAHNAPELIRCKDCKAWIQYDDMNLGECELYPEYNKMGDWFCNFGERKSENESDRQG